MKTNTTTEVPASQATLRDLYASRILAALAVNVHQPPEKIVERAFALADLAIAERER